MEAAARPVTSYSVSEERGGEGHAVSAAYVLQRSAERHRLGTGRLNVLDFPKVGVAVCLIACFLLHILRRYLLALARGFLRSTPKRLPTSVTMEMTS
jgi:hypothetical protein